MNEEALFPLALEKPAGVRAAFLDAACAGDPALRQRVLALLRAHDNPGNFLAGLPVCLPETIGPRSDQPPVPTPCPTSQRPQGGWGRTPSCS